MTTLPAVEFLGYGINLLTTGTFSIDGTTANISRAAHLIQMDTTNQSVTAADTTYTAPSNVSISAQANAESIYTTYASGADAKSDFKTHGSLSVSYMAVSGSASIDYAFDKHFHVDYQYALFNSSKDQYRAVIDDYASWVNTTVAKEAVSLGAFTADNIESFRSFFNNYGSHVILSALYGSRYLLNVWCTNSNEAVNTEFKTDVTAAYNGITTGGSVNATVSTEAQYSIYSQNSQQLVSVKGGDPNLALQLHSDPRNLSAYKAWLDTTDTNPDIVSFQIEALWALYGISPDSTISDAGVELKKAYDYIAQTPKPKSLHQVTVQVISDWAIFDLLSPSAIININPPIDPLITIPSTTRLQFGEGGNQFIDKTFQFAIYNDGSPIDIALSHGSLANASSTTLPGSVTVIFEGGDTVVNNTDNDNVTNTQNFYGVAV